MARAVSGPVKLVLLPSTINLGPITGSLNNPSSTLGNSPSENNTIGCSNIPNGFNIIRIYFGDISNAPLGVNPEVLAS
eukprot:scaffold33614_cov73-Skeletonema_marinoi.AAC.1